jgi:uncharacterized damage-inducible protein DinB
LGATFFKLWGRPACFLSRRGKGPDFENVRNRARLICRGLATTEAIMSDHDSFGAAYFDEARRSFRGYKRLADQALEQVDDHQFFFTPNAESNSLAQLVKHVAGNMRSRWTDFLTSDGEKPDRNRDQEFVITSSDTREELMRRWEAGFAIVFETLQNLRPEDITTTVYIRSEPHSVLQAINRSLNHTAHHIGQILFLAKMMRGTGWQCLSIPRGKSEEVNARMLAKANAKAPNKA